MLVKKQWIRGGGGSGGGGLGESIEKKKKLWGREPFHRISRNHADLKTRRISGHQKKNQRQKKGG